MILLTLLNFVKAYRARFNTEATVLFVTAAEAEELNGAAEMLLRFPVAPDVGSQVYGKTIHESPFGDLIRERTLNLKLSEFFTWSESSELTAEFRQNVIDEMTRRFAYEMRCYLACDITRLNVEVESDSWAWLKRWQPLPSWLRWSPVLKRWWTIRTKTVAVDCCVLYPKVKVQLPQYLHTVKFSLNNE